MKTQKDVANFHIACSLCEIKKHLTNVIELLSESVAVSLNFRI
jgi:hypothetical protein